MKKLCISASVWASPGDGGEIEAEIQISDEEFEQLVSIAKEKFEPDEDDVYDFEANGLDDVEMDDIQGDLAERIEEAVRNEAYECDMEFGDCESGWDDDESEEESNDSEIEDQEISFMITGFNVIDI